MCHGFVFDDSKTRLRIGKTLAGVKPDLDLVGELSPAIEEIGAGGRLGYLFCVE
jgi:hypothetical protein